MRIANDAIKGAICLRIDGVNDVTHGIMHMEQLSIIEWNEYL